MPEERWAERAYRLVELVGRPVVDDAVAHVEYATVDSIRHFARAYGDGNPLYSDPAYAAAGPWRGLVAPPLFPIAAGVPAPPGDGPPAVDVGALLGGSEPTVLSDSWTFHRPIAEGTRLDRVSLLMAVRAGPARSPEPIDVTIRRQYLAEGRLYATQDRVRRYAPARRPIGDWQPRAIYTPEALARIEADHDRQTRRGSRPRWVEDVAPGDRLGPMVKGPLTITDLVTYRSGVGPGPLGAEALELARPHRAGHPALYAVDASNVPDTVERRHWDEDYARSLGYPTVYDYSHTRLTWLGHLVTDWMGDGAWLQQLSASVTGMNYLGDTHWLEGSVVGPDDDRADAVRIELQARNQRHEITCTGTAVVLLPRRPADVVRLE